jgi:phosphohistidine swiveling domain-containing protein
MSAVWREQPMAYRFVDGHVLTEELRVRSIDLSNDALRQIATSLDPLLDIYEDAALEFGVMKNAAGHEVYLIDVAEGDVGGISLDAQLINSGVLSTGRCRGRAVKVDLSAIGSLDKHLHDRPSSSQTKGESIVIVAERASVDLLPYVGASGVVGFLFERGSILAHLAVVLREKHIPAIAIDDAAAIQDLTDNCIIEIDASKRELAKRERITLTEVSDASNSAALHQS